MKISLNQIQFTIGTFKDVCASIEAKLKRKTTVILPCSLNDFAAKTKKPELEQYYRNVDIATTDSMILTKWLDFKYSDKIERVYGPDLMNLFLNQFKNKELNVVFLGADQTSLNTLKQLNSESNYKAKFILLKKSDSTEKEKRAVQQIIKLNPDVIWLGIGSPKQVELAFRIKPYVSSSLIFCVGAAFDFVTGNKNSAPQWMKNNALEWLYRLLQEPTRLWKRYLIDIPQYLAGQVKKQLF